MGKPHYFLLGGVVNEVIGGYGLSGVIWKRSKDTTEMRKKVGASRSGRKERVTSGEK